jgi:hypothetical protein
MLLRKIVAAFLLLIGILPSITAHEGGHYHSGDGSVFNTWRLQNGEQVVGNFSAYENNRIILEWENGKLISLPMESFSKMDQRLLQSKISQTEAINRTPIFSEPATESGYYFTPVPLLLCLLILGILFMLKKSNQQFQLLPQNYRRTSYWITGALVIFFSCKKTADSNPNNTTTGTSIVVPKTRTGFMDSVFAAFKPSVNTNFDNTYYYVSATGFPNHNMMVGITSWQQQVPIPQNYTGTNSWSIPLQPVMAAVPLSTKSNFMKGAVALAVNGIPIFNALNNRGEDSYKIGELDNWGGHCGKADDYHYHAAPLHLATVTGNLPIAYALDGFPVYGEKEPDGTTLTSLDSCHGHPWNTTQYHYHGTATYPYVVGAMRGKVILDPSTPAPENQILPQAFAKGARPATNPLNGASITNFVSSRTNAYLLTYKIGTKFGSVAYSWDASNKFTYTLTDTSGQSATNTYQR